MREIKYKAFILGKMWEVRAIYWTEDGVFVHTDGGFMYLCEEDNIHLLEYTGLKDKNGKEIYEGDIIIGHPYSSDALEVFWDDGQCGWELRSENYGTHFIDFSGGSDLGYQPFEVIGNKYENPELLED